MIQASNLLHRRLLPRTIYLALLAVLVAAEYPLNVSVFQIFALPIRETAVMAVGIGIALVGLAHLLGVTLARLGKVPDRARAVTEIAVAVVLAFVLGVGVARLGLVRAAYLADLQRQVDLGITLSKRTLSSFTFIQLLIVAVATGASFFTHNEEADELERAARAHRRTARRERRVEDRLVTSEKRFVQVQAKRDTMQLRFNEVSAASAHWYEFLKWERRSANVRAHIEGPRSEFLRIETPPIPQGAWTQRSFELNVLPGDEGMAATGITDGACPVRLPQRPNPSKSASQRGERS